jgi:uncharacterized protein YjiS (DUF1127 family)
MTSIFSRLFRGSKQRRALSDLMQLDDHLLRDIGVTRAELKQVLRNRGDRIWTHE